MGLWVKTQSEMNVKGALRQGQRWSLSAWAPERSSARPTGSGSEGRQKRERGGVAVGVGDRHTHLKRWTRHKCCVARARRCTLRRIGMVVAVAAAVVEVVEAMAVGWGATAVVQAAVEAAMEAVDEGVAAAVAVTTVAVKFFSN